MVGPIGLTGLPGCGGEPPEEMGGFSLHLSQQELLRTARQRPGFGCVLRATRPPVTFCRGPDEQGYVTATARGDSVSDIALRLEPAGRADEPDPMVRELVDPVGEPAWRDRPMPPRAAEADSFHTLWLTDDSTRALALVCARPELGAPCTARLSRTSPAEVLGLLDSLLGIR